MQIAFQARAGAYSFPSRNSGPLAVDEDLDEGFEVEEEFDGSLPADDNEEAEELEELDED